MPRTEVVVYAEEDGSAPLLRWLADLPQPMARDKITVRIERLQDMGHELRRPEADYLRDGIYELRVAAWGVQYRVLYFFGGKRAVLSHGIIKKSGAVPAREIEVAIGRRALFEADPNKHAFAL